MERRKIIWHTPAYHAYTKVIAWYTLNCGISFATTYSENTESTIDTLSAMPSIGKLVRIVGKKHYSQFISHPKTIIRYWYDDSEIHIVDLKATMLRRLK